MKKYILLLVMALLGVSCSGQESKAKKEEIKQSEKNIVEIPEGTWKVDKEFDENGNLIRYDSIYSWSSGNKFNNLSSLERDSLIESFESTFLTNFSQFENQGFENISQNLLNLKTRTKQFSSFFLVSRIVFALHTTTC